MMNDVCTNSAKNDITDVENIWQLTDGNYEMLFQAKRSKLKLSNPIIKNNSNESIIITSSYECQTWPRGSACHELTCKTIKRIITRPNIEL